MSFPDIHLEAVNKTAAFLLTKKGVDPKPAEEYISTIRADMERVDAAISSINGQLKTRTDPGWAPAAIRARNKYLAQKKTLRLMMHSANEILLTIRSRLRKDVHADALKSADEVRDRKQKERMERIAAAAQFDNRTHVLFKRKVAKILGEERCIALLKEAEEEAGK
jgi:hypothetical protein